MAEAKVSKNPFSRIGKSLKDMRSEAKKVIWPTAKQVKNNTAIVIGSILLVGVVIWALDFVFGLGVTLLL